MASITAPRIHISALADVTSNLNIPRVRPTGKDRKVRFVPTTRITYPSNIRAKSIQYKPSMAEENYRKILESPDPISLLNADSPAVSDVVAPPSPNMGRRRDKSVSSASSSRSSTPTSNTPPVTRFGGKQLIAIRECSTTAAKSESPATPTLSYKCSLLDKALPPKPTLRSGDSPERRGLLDATDSDSSLPTHPALQPESSGGESLSSFELASSLGTPSTLNGEFEVGTGVIIEGEIISSVTGMDLGKAKPINAIPVRSTSKIASPIHRVSQGLKRQPSTSSLNQRQGRYGVGLTIRKSVDAHELIMGPEASSDSSASLHPPRTSSLPKGVKSIGQLSAASRLSRPTAASAARAAESKKAMLTPTKTTGKSFLNRASVSKVSIISSANNSTTSAERGLRSRISGIFSSKNRRTIVNSNTDNKGYNAIIDEKETLDLTSPTINKRASLLLTTYHNSGMDAKAISVENIRGDKKGSFMGKMTDREPSAQEYQDRTREERRINRVGESVAHGMAQSRTSRGATRVGHGDDQPPTPPPTREGPVGHYGESETAVVGANRMSEEDFDRYLEDQLNTAEQELNAAIQTAHAVGVGSAEVFEAATRVIDFLGNAILTARTAHMADIRLRAATANLIAHTTASAEEARRAIETSGV